MNMNIASSMRSKLVRMILVLVVAGSSLGLQAGVPKTAAADKPIFKDISKHWAKSTIESMAGTGILNGYSDGTFRPDDPIQVDEFIKILIMSLTEKTKYEKLPVFWKEKVWNRFDPLDQRAYSEKFGYWNFQPAAKGYWAQTYIDVANEIFLVFAEKFYNYKANVKREEAARIIFHTLNSIEFTEEESYSRRATWGYKDIPKLDDNGKKYAGETMTKGIMSGYDTKYFGVGKLVTRAEALTIIQRLNDSTKRKPVKIDLTNVPHVIAPIYFNMYKRVEILATNKMKLAYDKFVEIGSKNSKELSSLNSTAIRMFKDKEAKEYYLSRKNSFEIFKYEASLSVFPSNNSYAASIYIKDNDSWRRQEKSFEDFFVYLLGETQGKLILSEMETAAKKMQEKSIESNYSKDLGVYLLTVGSKTGNTINNVSFILSEKTKGA
ncbi:S-layer homology domain-containing protein [Paenibacillus sp. GCM10023252]|uniref:S-layer homology domain-containing protein n=1 Tax=Paenibacillus sp. GCM10023252 TaxID=3252649 RepID=UPI003619EAF9